MPWVAAIAAPLVGALAGKLLGPKQGGATANVPNDLGKLRAQDIRLLSSILGAPDAASRTAILENFFGPLASSQQTEASGVFSNIAGDNGANTIAAMMPQYQKNIAYANQSGGRFGSANALMRASAANDFNMLSAQIGERAQDRRLNAAQNLSALGQQLTANRVGLLNQLLGTSQSATLGQPVTTTPSGAQQGAAFGGGIGDILMQAMPYLLRQQGQGATASNAPIGSQPYEVNPLSRTNFGSQ